MDILIIKEYIKYFLNRKKKKNGWMRIKSFPLGKYGRWQQRGIWDGKYQEIEVVGEVHFNPYHHSWQLPVSINSISHGRLPIHIPGAKVLSANGKWRKIPDIYYYFKRIDP